MVKNKALPDSARLCTPCLVTLSLSLSPFLSLSPSQTWPYQGWSHMSSLSLSRMPFILRVPPGSCRGWTPADVDVFTCDFLNCELNWVLERPLYNIFLLPSSRAFLEGRCFLLAAHRPSAREQRIQSCCCGNWPQGGIMCLRPCPGYWGNQSLGESPVPGLPVRVERARRNTEGLCPIPSSFLTPMPWTHPSSCNTPVWRVL